jgi:photosystem II stability/assembly factor-like uncharacterized protein
VRPNASSADDIVPGVVIVKLKMGTLLPGSSLAKAPAALRSVLGSAGVIGSTSMFPENTLAGALKRADAADLARIYLAALSPGRDPRTAARRIAASPDVEYAEPKYLQTLFDIPNDPGVGNQILAFTRLNVYNGWTLAKGSAAVTIATIDGGTKWDHDDLLPNLLVNAVEDLNGNGRYDPGPPPAGDEDGIDQDANGKPDDLIGWNFTTSTNNPKGVLPQSYSHGTATASHSGAATNNGLGMAGSAWNCSLLPVCVASARSDNSIEFGYEGIAYAAQRGARVINCSWGRLGAYSQFEQNVLTAVANAGVLVVAAAGNNNVNADLLPHFPACYSHVLAVGATNSTDDGRAYFTNYGALIPVYAPGVSIWSALTSGGYGDGGSGTSYSSPLVAGLAGILRVQHPAWSPEQVAAQIRVTADPIDNLNPGEAGLLGHGRVNFARALAEVRPALEIASATLRATNGHALFLTGDTIAVTVSVRNVLPAAAVGLQFQLGSRDAALTGITTTAALSSLAPGAQATLSEFRFVVGGLDVSRDASLVLSWTATGEVTDKTAFRLTLFPSLPFWITQLAPVSASLTSVHAPSATVVWASGGDGNATDPVVTRTTDGGTTWTDVTGNLPQADFFAVRALNASRAWVGSGDGRIFTTSDGGQTWSQQAYPGIQSPFIDGIWFFDANAGVALGDPPAGSSQFVVLATTNGGSSWTHIGEPVGISGEAGWNNSFWWTDAQHGWFGTNKDRLWHTTDGGAHWSTSGPTGNASSYGIAFRDNLNGVAVHDAGIVGRTTDGGTTFTSTTLAGSPTLTGAAFPPGAPDAWTASTRIMFASTTSGATWEKQSTYPFSGGISHLWFTDTVHGWAVTSNGEVLKYDPTAVTGTDLPGETPAGYALLPNYPNPFNPGTEIRFNLPAAGFVRLTVFDLLGREVERLVEGSIGPGLHTARFTGHARASGVYVVRLTVEGEDGGTRAVRSQKMLLLK